MSQNLSCIEKQFGYQLSEASKTFKDSSWYLVESILNT